MITALVSGANKGVGFATARALGRLGAKVWVGARSTELGRNATERMCSEGIDAEFIQLDVTDSASIAAAALRMADSSPALDILVNNAGIMTELNFVDFTPNPASLVSLDTLRKIYETNLFGAIAVTQAMLPMLSKSPRGRIVNVSSRLGSIALQTDERWAPRALNQLGYGSSKAALNMATAIFSYELRNTRIKINAVSPGTIATDLSGAKAEDLAGKPGFASPDQGAEVVVRYATLADDGPSGRFFGPDGELEW
jgi:NAD(P)-dependent dehydrogenase (short-subunit alcohol dehydrogenase family)